MKVSANIKYLRISAQKLRLSADLVRGQRALSAQEQLQVMPQKSAKMIAAALKSAIANAENNFSLNPASLTIGQINVDGATKLKRGRPRSRGMTHPISHPMAHLKIILDDNGSDQPKAQSAAIKPAKSAVKPKVTTTIKTKKRGLR